MPIKSHNDFQRKIITLFTYKRFVQRNVKKKNKNELIFI